MANGNNIDLVKKPKQKEEYTNLAGISDASKNNLNYYAQGYQPSQQVNQAQEYLQKVMSGQPGAFQSKYTGDIDSLYRQIMQRPQFKYDLNTDPAYQQYKHHYTTLGQRAMQDVIGDSAALTGGYGNSWGATAGSQAYQAYLQQLNDIVPQLEDRAYQRYAQEGQDLRQNLNTAQGLMDTEYGQHRDTVGDWMADREFAAQQYGDDYQRDYNQWMSMLNYWQQMAQAENENFWNQQNYDFALRQYEDAQRKTSGATTGKKKGTPQKMTPEDFAKLAAVGIVEGGIGAITPQTYGPPVTLASQDAQATAAALGSLQAPEGALIGLGAPGYTMKDRVEELLNQNKKNNNGIGDAVNSILKGTP